MGRGAVWLAGLMLPGALPAAMPRVPLDLPAGRLGDAVTELSRQAGISIAVDDGALWQRPVPRLRGTIAIDAALRRLLANSGAEAVPVARDAWRIRVRAPHRASAPAARPAAAPDADAIVVTASKRDTRLDGFAGAASLIAGARLVRAGPGTTDTIVSQLATISSTYFGAGRNKLFIRGIADSSFTGPTQATVGQYLGDLRLTYNAPDPDLRLYDMERVEVLEGPQGTLYGAGSLGGIIRFTPMAPDITRLGVSVQAGASATQHGAPGGDAAGMLNVPLGQGRALRVVGYHVREGGYIDNPTLGARDVNRTDTAGGRATLRVALEGGTTIDVGGVLQSIKGRSSQYADEDAPRLTQSSPVAEPYAARYRLFDAVIGHDWAQVRLRASAGYARQRLTESFDATQPGDAPALFRQRTDTRLLTGEVRLWQPLDRHWGWLIGASATRNRSRIDRGLGPVDTVEPVTGVLNIARDANVYGEASVKPLSWLTVTLGGRAAWTRIAGGALHVPPVELSPMQILERVQITRSRNGATLLPSASLVAEAAPGLTLFLRAQRSFRPGGLTADGGYVRRYRADRVQTVEAGMRRTVGRRGLDLTLSGSWTRWRDIQADYVNTDGFVTTANIGSGRIWSVSAGAGWSPVAGLRFDGAAVFNDGRVTRPDVSARFEDGAPVVISRIPNVARVSGRVGVAWEHRAGGERTLRIDAWARAVGRSRLGLGPLLGRTQGDYCDSAVTARLGTDGAGVTLAVTNLADSMGNRFALGTPFPVGSGQITPLRPRTVRLGFDARF